MHYLAWALLPDDGSDVTTALEALMEPHLETYGEDDSHSGFYDWYIIGGRWSGSLVGKPARKYGGSQEDITTVADVLNGEPSTPFSIIWPGGVAHRETWDGKNWIETDEGTHNRTVATVLLAHKDHRLVVVDYHS